MELLLLVQVVKVLLDQIQLHLVLHLQVEEVEVHPDQVHDQEPMEVQVEVGLLKLLPLEVVETRHQQPHLKDLVEAQEQILPQI